MRKLAESWGDQSYGAVVVAAGKVLGYGPSRVVKDNDPNAHAERVAIREAQRAQSGSRLTDAVLYSTSRPCLACEQAAASAGILRMYFGEALHDAGVPRVR
jgi:tRNA(adenine34) deaminase